MGVTKHMTIPRQSTEDFLGINEHEDSPTPVLGSWADVWSSRQASDIILDDLDCKDGSGKENAFDAAVGELQLELEQLRDDVVEVASQEEEDVEVPVSDDSIAMSTEATSEDAHQRHVYVHNPYNITAPRTDLYVCECADCVAVNQAMHAEMAAATAAALQVPEEEPKATPPSPRIHIKTNGSAPKPISGSPLTTTAAAAAAPAGGFETHSTVPPPPRHVPTVQLSAFMPPAPPSLQTKQILERGGSVDVDTFLYHTMMRWYSKLLNVQLYFVPEDDQCPAPDAELMSFDKWCAATNDWWYRHFEFAQLKPHAFFQASNNGGYYLQHSNTSPFRGNEKNAAPQQGSGSYSQCW